MHKSILLCLFLATSLWASFPSKSSAIERRCGWLQNPTPANWFLVDRDGQWTIGLQGGYQAKGMEAIPDLSRDEYVQTNGSYGYACACLDVEANAAAKRITIIYQASQLPLATCREDPALPSE